MPTGKVTIDLEYYHELIKSKDKEDSEFKEALRVLYEACHTQRNTIAVNEVLAKINRMGLLENKK